MNRSEKNLEIIGKMIDREGFYLQNFIADLMSAGMELPGNDFPTWDDCENLYSVEVADKEYYSQDEIDERIEDIEDLYPDIDNPDWAEACEENRKIAEEYEELREAELESAEVYQWFLTTEWMANKLSGQGEVILEWSGCYWWGRQACGMAINYDGCFYRIAEEMEILEGQKYAWL